MTAAETKLQLLQLILESNDQGLIEHLSAIVESFNKAKKADWAGDLPEYVIDDIISSLNEPDSEENSTRNEDMLKDALNDFPTLRS